MKMLKLGAYWKAFIAFGGALATFLITVAAIGADAGVNLPAWVYGLGTGLAVLTGGATYQKRNTPVPQIDPVSDVIDDFIRTPEPRVAFPKVELPHVSDGVKQASDDVLSIIEDLIGGFNKKK